MRKDGTVWTTDKDGVIMDLLAAEITAKTGKDPAQHYRTLADQFGDPVYSRSEAPADRKQKVVLKDLSPEQVSASELAGEVITAKLTRAPGNDAAIGGLKVVTENGWFCSATFMAPKISIKFMQKVLWARRMSAPFKSRRKLLCEKPLTLRAFKTFSAYGVHVKYFLV